TVTARSSMTSSSIGRERRCSSGTPPHREPPRRWPSPNTSSTPSRSRSEVSARGRERAASLVLATTGDGPCAIDSAADGLAPRLTDSLSSDSLGNASLGADESGLLLELGDVVVEDVGGRRISGIDLVMAAAHRGDGRLDRLDHVVDGVVGADLAVG